MPQDKTRSTGIAPYLFAIVSGLFTGWVNEVMVQVTDNGDALLTAVCVLGFTMLLGAWKPARPWRWGLLVWMGVPLALLYFHFVKGWPHNRGQVYGAVLQLLAANAGAFGGHFMRHMIDSVFRRDDRYQKPPML